MTETIKRLSFENLEEILEIEKECFTHPWSREQLIIALNNPSFLGFGIFGQDKLIGYISSFVLDKEAEILNLAVLPFFRRQKKGAALLKQLIDYLRTQKVEKIFLEVRKSNYIAKSLYFKFGFKEISIRRNYYPDNKEDALVMGLVLKQ